MTVFFNMAFGFLFQAGALPGLSPTPSAVSKMRAHACTLVDIRGCFLCWVLSHTHMHHATPAIMTDWTACGWRLTFCLMTGTVTNSRSVVWLCVIFQACRRLAVQFVLNGSYKAWLGCKLALSPQVGLVDTRQMDVDDEMNDKVAASSTLSGPG